MYNQITLIGRLTADPSLTATNSGHKVSKFTMAVNRSYKQNGERKADFFNVTAWNGTAEFMAKYIQKGDMIAVIGRVEIHDYKDKNGIERKSFDVIADTVVPTSPKRKADDKQDEALNAGNFEEVDDDDLPFN